MKANYESCCKHKGYILPVYTESEDGYWLFYHPGTISDLQNLEPDTKIWGYWLNVTEDTFNYELLLTKKKLSIDAISIIMQENETILFLRRTLPLINNNPVDVPELFHDSILACLEKYGFT